VAGQTSNPHTLLNYLHSRVSRSEGVDIWTHARRNVIDVADVATAVDWLLDHAQNETVDIAAPQDYSVREIVSALEHATGKRARCAEVDAGRAYKIDHSRIAEAPIDFCGDYLGSVIRRYYA
jgi:nucleoside-diphosphate-sugar epimerase